MTNRKRTEIINRLKEFKKKLSKKYLIDRFVLFGSFAKGTNTKSSDIDLIIVSKNFKNMRYRNRMPDLYNYWELDYPVDFICYTPEEFKERLSKISICRTGVREGVEI